MEVSDSRILHRKILFLMVKSAHCQNFLSHFLLIMPQKISKKTQNNLRKDAIISTFVKNVRPVDYFKVLYPNDYHAWRMDFTVVDLELEGDKYFTVLKHSDHPKNSFDA